MASGRISNFMDWLCIAGGTAMLLATATMVWESLSRGHLEFSSAKFGVSFTGVEAGLMYAAYSLASVLLVVFGWRGLRRASSIA